jgi:hypothetical protein
MTKMMKNGTYDISHPLGKGIQEMGPPLADRGERPKSVIVLLVI